MRSAGVKAGIGTRFVYDGEIIEIVELHTVEGEPEAMTKDLRTGVLRRIALGQLMFSDRSCVLNDDLLPNLTERDSMCAAVTWDAAPESARREARVRAAHVREILTGYRSGNALTALAHEPRAAYRGEAPLGERVAAKAHELQCGLRTVERWISKYRRDGEVGLLAVKAVQPDVCIQRFEVFEQTALEIMIEHTDYSRPSQDHVIAHARARIRLRYGDGVALPSRATAYRILERLERRHPIFHGSSKRNRDIAARSLQAYGKLHPARPGEYTLMDTTPLDVFAMDPQTLRWVSVELTVAMDWYSRCITGLRLTPVSTKAVDAAAVLYQCFRPAPAWRDWPADAVWPPHGVPKSVLVEVDALDPASVFTASPAIAPETVVVDHGKIYVGEVLTSVCRQMGISIQPAKVRQARDKGPVERFFRTIREGFLQELPGYKGPDVYSRGLSPESDAYFFLDELEALLREWVACVYHRRPHDGVGEAGLWALGMSPVQMFEHGIARSGYLQVPRDPNLAYHFLPVHWRRIKHYGVEVNGRIYRATVLVDYVGCRSPYTERDGKWPFHANPDDIRQIYFFDLHHTQTWYVLMWTHASLLTAPMNEDGLVFARDLARAKHRVFDDQLALAELLERRNLTQGRTPAERRAALRICREQSSLEIDLAAAVDVNVLPQANRVLGGIDPAQAAAEEAASFTDDLDDVPFAADGGIYDDVLEDL